MPSPFPGMDPYLEDRHVWRGFHNGFASRFEELLNGSLPEGYYAETEIGFEVGIVGADEQRAFITDIGMRPELEPAGGGTALAQPRTQISEGTFDFFVTAESYRVASVRIRDARVPIDDPERHEIVTAVELFSPSNKRSGPDREQYELKRELLLSSDASFIEIDLLRSGRGFWDDRDPGVRAQRVIRHDSHYLVTVSRAWEREPRLRVQAFPVALTDVLPVIPVPLRQDEAEVPLDLQYCFDRTYDAGPYRRGGVNYADPPTPPLPAELRPWAADRVAAWRAAR